MSVRQIPYANDSPCLFATNHSPKICQRVSSPKTISQRFANLSVRQNPFANNSPKCQLAKNHSPMIWQRVSSPKTIRQRFGNVSVRQKPFAYDLAVAVSQNPFGKDSPTCQFAKKHSPMICQRVSSPKNIHQRVTNPSVRQGDPPMI